MKKILTLVAIATLLMAGSAFAQWGRHAVAQPNATFAFGTGAGAAAAAVGPNTTNNDDSCDIGVTPAATLLLPYFEVDTATRAVDTWFTITNVSNLPQIAHVTVYTDWSYAVLDFNIFLTGYDVQPISLYDVIVNGIIAPTGQTASGAWYGGTSSSPTYNGGTNAPSGAAATSPVGAFSAGSSSLTNTCKSCAVTTANPNITDISNCGALPGNIPSTLRQNVQNALVAGTAPAGYSCTVAVGSAATHGGNTNANTAIGYITVDVVSNCTVNMSDSPTYIAGDLLFDNVLTGDYEVLNKGANANYSTGNTMVHIRAIPEGGKAGQYTGVTVNQTNLPYTFYSRYINGTTPITGGPAFTGVLTNFDRRQPLPSTWAARYIQAGAAGANTTYRIWREGATATTTCTSSAAPGAPANSALPVTEMVRFDEHENPALSPGGVIISPGNPGAPPFSFPETSNFSVSNANNFPQFASGATSDIGGWMYMNLDSGKAVSAANIALHTAWPSAVGYRASQNWVVVSMSANAAGTGTATSGAYEAAFDATWLGNGCTPATAKVNELNQNPAAGPSVIGPAGGVLVCPAGLPAGACTAGVYPYFGTNVTP
jgi:hypothetical protein